MHCRVHAEQLGAEEGFNLRKVEVLALHCLCFFTFMEKEEESVFCPHLVQCGETGTLHLTQPEAAMGSVYAPRDQL